MQTLEYYDVALGQRNSEYKKLYNYFKNNIKPYLTGVINSMIITPEEQKTLRRLVTPINRVKKPVLMQSRVFSNPAKQYLDDEKANKIYQQHLTTSGFDAKTIEVEEMINLLGTVAYGPYFDTEDGIVRYRMFLPHQYCVKASSTDPTKMVEFRYSMDYLEKGITKKKIFKWTKDKYTREGKDENNPYGVIPFVLFKKDNSMSLYGEFPSDLLAYADSMLVLDADLSYAILQETLVTYLWTDIIDPNNSKDNEQAKKLARARQIFAKTKTNTTGPYGSFMPGQAPIKPDGKILQPAQHIEEITKAIEYKQKDFMRSWLIPQGQQEFQKTPSSYAGLKWTSEELVKWINERKILYHVSLRELFEKMRIVNNVHVANSKKLKKISEKAEWSVDFAEIPEIQTEQMRLAVQQQKINMNLISLVMAVKKNNRDLDTDEKAIKYLQKIKTHQDKTEEVFGNGKQQEDAIRSVLSVPETESETPLENKE